VGDSSSPWQLVACDFLVMMGRTHARRQQQQQLQQQQQQQQQDYLFPNVIIGHHSYITITIILLY